MTTAAGEPPNAGASGAQSTPPQGGQAGAGAATPARVLRRSREDRVLGGVCGGLGRYFSIDPILMRLLFVVFALAGGTAVLAYIVLWIVVPEEQAGDNVGAGAHARIDLDVTRGWQALGFVLVLVGAAMFAQQVFPWIDRIVWPIVIVVAGLALIVHGSTRR